MTSATLTDLKQAALRRAAYPEMAKLLEAIRTSISPPLPENAVVTAGAAQLFEVDQDAAGYLIAFGFSHCGWNAMSTALNQLFEVNGLPLLPVEG